MIFPHTLSIAPMMGWTDRHYRYLLRLITQRTVLYTELTVDSTLIHNPDHERFLGYNPCEHPLVAQIGGSNPETLAKAAQLCEQYGYDEINLNLGCPSDKVQKGNFGLILMRDLPLVLQIVKAIKSQIQIPLTVKCRLGVDEFGSDEYIEDFVKQIADCGVEHFILHARMGYLCKSAQQNRSLPPLQYKRVYALKVKFPDLKFTINGGIENLHQAAEHLTHVDGVMIGRSAWTDPWLFSQADEMLYGAPAQMITRREVLLQYADYAEQMQHDFHVKTNHLIRPLLHFYYALPRGKIFRQVINDHLLRNTPVREVILQGLKTVED